MEASVPAAGGGDTVPVRVTLTEAPPRRLELGIGYGSEERARASAKWSHANFFGGARQATAEGRWSSIDRGAKVGLVEPWLFHRGLSLTVGATAWRTSQLTFDSQTYGGQATAVYRWDTGADVPDREPTHYAFSFGYANEYLRYGIRADALGDLTARDERIALGLDPDTGRAAGTLASIDVDLERTAVDVPLAPTRGSVLTLHVDHAAPWLGGTYRYDELLTEARGYVPLGPAVVLAGRMRFGTLAAADPATVPFAARYFLGGSTSIRGWGRFQVSPLDENGLPIGGRSQFETSLELRFPVHGPLGGAAFVDAGNVWANDWELHPGDLRAAIGAGLRYRTPIGAIRADVGWQLNPMTGLVIDGVPESRRFRIHFSIGQSF